MASPNTMKHQLQNKLMDHQRKKMALVPRPGLVWSPLLRYPKNAKCFCGSGIKFKKCHDGRIKMAVMPDEAEQLKKYVDQVVNEGLNR